VLHQASPGSLRWHSRALGPGIVPGALHYPWHLLRTLRSFAPDVVVGASDIPHVVLGRWLARRLGRPYVTDLYDNFESFGQARIPGMVPALRRAVRSADVVVTTSEPLARFVRQTYRAHRDVFAMPSSVDLAVFHPRDRQTCRKQLGLPLGAKLVGTAGGLSRMKGIDTLYEAWRLLAAQNPTCTWCWRAPPTPTCPFLWATGCSTWASCRTLASRSCFAPWTWASCACPTRPLGVIAFRKKRTKCWLALCPWWRAMWGQSVVCLRQAPRACSARQMPHTLRSK